jgi:hypothetical protein
MRLNIDMDRPTDRGEFYKFQCSFIICDYDEDELISNDSNIVNYDKYKPYFPLKNLLIIMDKINIYINSKNRDLNENISSFTARIPPNLQRLQQNEYFT